MEKPQIERTSFPKAVKTVLDTLEKGEAFSITHLARETNLNRRTVEKVLNLLCEVQKSFDDKRLDIMKVNKAKIVQLRRKVGLLNLPEELQKSIVRAIYFPIPSREEELLVYAYLKKAWSPENAIDLERTRIVEKLLKQGQFLESEEKKIYLSAEGRIVAKGALKLYPELEKLSIM